MVDGIDAEHTRMEAANLAPGPIRQINLLGRTARFFFMQDPDGCKVEVIERGGRFR